MISSNTKIINSSAKYNKAIVFIACAVLVTGAIIAYEPMRQNGFVSYDDGKYITENPHVKQGLTLETLKWAFTKPHYFMWHPITTISYLLEYQFFGTNPLVSHFINLVFHIFNVFLVFLLMRKITDSTDSPKSGAFWASAFAAAVFAVHPLQVETVAWAAERKNVISTFFALLTIWSYFEYSAAVPAAAKRFKYYLLVIIFFILAMMSKPMAVTLPFVLLLLDFWPLKRMTRQTIGKLILEKIPLFLLSAVLCVITVIAQQSGGVIKTEETMPQFAFQYRFENAIVSYISYLSKFFCPVNLAVFYSHLGAKMPLWQPIFAFLALAAITAVLFYLGRKRGYLITGWLWYAGTLVPVIGLIQVGGQSMADRYMYLPMIGLLIIISKLISEIVTKLRYVIYVVLTAIFVILIIATRNQVKYWHDDFTLFGHAIEATKDNENMHYNIGHSYQQKGQFDKAIEHYRESLRIMPGDLQAMNNLGVILLSQRKTDEALKIFEKAVQMNSRYIDSLNNLGLALREKGRASEAIEKWKQVIAIEPGQPQAEYNIAFTEFGQGKYKDAAEHFKKSLEKEKHWDVYNYLGIAYSALGQYKAALDSYNEALKLKPGDVNIELNIALALTSLGDSQQALQKWNEILTKDPNNAKAYYGLGRIFADKKEYDKAIEYFNKFLIKEPNFYEAHFRIANVYYEKKDFASAAEQLKKALSIKSNYIEAMNLLSWIEATTKEQNVRNPDEAMRLATLACELTGNKNPGLLDTLAVAYAAAGKFEDAVKTEEKALEFARKNKLNKLAESISKKLELFKAKKVYYEE